MPPSALSSYLLGLALAAAPAFAAPLASNGTKGTIAWNNCEHAWWLPSNLQCGNFTVPVNWDNPHGETVQLSLVRLLRPENATAKRIGSLFVNPGGPGGQAIVMVAEYARGMTEVSPEIRNSFDIIGLDPRGVGMSGWADCDYEIWNERVSQFPKSKADFDRLVDKNRRLGESCIERTGDIVNHYDTLSTVKDLEAVRAALGEKLNWLGLSYGTQIGAQYAHLYPQNVRSMVLDGVLQHSQSEATNMLIETTAYSAALRTFFKWAENDNSSPLKGQDVEELWNSVLKKAAESPIPAPEHLQSQRPDVTQDEFLLNAQGFLIAPTDATRVRFATELKKASEGDATAFSSRVLSRFDTDIYAGITIGCQDWGNTLSTWEDFQAKMRVGEIAAPLTKGASQSWTVQASCVGWPAPRANPPAKLNVNTQNPILIVNSLYDPSTGYAWAAGMLEEIKNRMLLSRNGDGHTSWGTKGATTKAMVDFLVAGKLPAPGTVLDS